MDERWHQVRQIFDSALRRGPEERREFVIEACGEDKSLLIEVESLLSSLGSADSFLEMPVASKVVDMINLETRSLERGQLLGHYEIIEQIGEGGMGEVYLAKDTRLNRKVALKLLAARITNDKNRVSRFRQEAFATSSLNHPNIVTIHEIGNWQGRDFIVTEFIDGMTLRAILKEKRVSVGEALNVALPVASALAAAHGAGVVHRDIKPENIMVRADGLVKVLDFGIAKYLPADEGKRALIETQAGEVIGTAGYMSPEQARGLEVDARTDVWSLGVIIYEMVAGKLPFDGDTKSDRIAAILERDPKPLTKMNGKVPSKLESIVGHALAKDRQQRYPEIAPMAEDLQRLRETTSGKSLSPLILPPRRSAVARRWLPIFTATLVLAGIAVIGYLLLNSAVTAPAAKRSLAVLPLRPIGSVARDEIYEIGIADSLINRLSSMNGFVVRPLNAVRKYADAEPDPVTVGREQQVDYVLTSNYQVAGNRIRITSQLFNVSAGEVEETYKSEKDTTNVFAVQDAVATEMGNRLLARFATTLNNATATRGTDDEEAYRLYLQGMYFYDRRSTHDAYKAAEVLKQAVNLDPKYARAWAGLAHAHRYIANFDPDVNIHDENRKSMEAINTALALDESVSEAYSALCENKTYYEYDFASAEIACKRSIELRPDSAVAHNIYARFLISRGRFEEAIVEINRAIDLDPTAYFHQLVYTVCLSMSRRYEEAARQMDRLATLNPNNAANIFWSVVGAVPTQGNSSESYERWMKYLTAANADEQTIQLYRSAYQNSGWPGVIRERTKRFNENPSQSLFFTAAMNAHIGDKDKAMELLERSYQRRLMWMAYLQVEPRLDGLRDDPRFKALVARVESGIASADQ